MLVERHTGYGTASWKEQQEDDVLVAATDIVVQASAEQTEKWANRPRNRWPLSKLAGYDVTAIFNHDGLLDISHDGDGLTSTELSAWASDVLRMAGLPKTHAAWEVTVGQFNV